MGKEDIRTASAAYAQAPARMQRVGRCNQAMAGCAPLCEGVNGSGRKTNCVGVCTTERALETAERMQREFPVDMKNVPKGAEYEVAKFTRHVDFDKLGEIYMAKVDLGAQYSGEYPDIVHDQLHHIKICQSIIGAVSWTACKESVGTENIAAKVLKIKGILELVLRKDNLAFGPMIINKREYWQALIPEDEARSIAQQCSFHAGDGGTAFWNEAEKEASRVREQTGRAMVELNSEPQIMRAVSESMLFVQKMMERIAKVAGAD